jgi:ubiquinone/menaquinone biosynthesis C-methylase UbiE
MYRPERIPEEGVETYTKLAEYKREFYREVADCIPKTKLVLDVGTGPGILLSEVAKLIDGIVIGIDCTKKFGGYARFYAKKEGVGSKVEFIAANAYLLPFKDEAFGCVVSTGVLHDLKYPEKFFEEIYRVLKPSGIALIKDPTPLRISYEEAEKILSKEEMKVFREYRNFERNLFGSEIPWTFSEKEVMLMLERLKVKFKHVDARKKEGVLALLLVK